jgi:hypothetical protein
MMPVEFPESNKVLGKPMNMSDEECMSLPVYSDGKVCVSCWQLNKEDLDLIQQTGRIYLTILSGPSQPPVSLQVEPPFVNHFENGN